MAQFDVDGQVEINDDDIIAYVKKAFRPEDVFDESELEAWAEGEGWDRG